MKKHLALAAAVLMIAGLARASAIEDASADDSFNAAVTGQAGEVDALKNGPCSQINPTADQKAALKTAFVAFETARIANEAAVKTARLNYFTAASDAKVAFPDAQTASNALADSLAKAIDAKLAFKTQVLFQILTPEQRGPALKCEMLHRKHKHHGHRRGGKGHGKKDNGQGNGGSKDEAAQ